MEPAPSPAGPSTCRAIGVILPARCRPGLVSSSRPPATTPAPSTQNPSAPAAPSVSESRNRAPTGRVASRCRNVTSPECSPTQRATNAAASAPASSPAIASGPCLRTANRYPNAPETAPPARHTRQYATSAAMNAVVSVWTRAAAPGAVITSSARGATAAQPSPATTPSAAVPAATASAATAAGTASRHRQERTASSPRAGSGKDIGTDMVASSVRDLRGAWHGGRFQPDRKPCYGELRNSEPVVRFSVRAPAERRHPPRRGLGKPRDRGTGSHQALRGQARRRPSDVPGRARPGDRVPRAERGGQVNDDAAGARPGPARGGTRDD